MAVPPVFIGTAGWSVPTRHRERFPEAGSHLERYAARFNAVEINSSFYRSHQRKTYERWSASVPGGFRFAVKLPKAISHEQRLVDCDDALARFADEAGGLGAKFGAVLVQLPPNFAFDAEVASTFFALLQHTISARVVFEPRHTSWFTGDVEQFLTDQKIARVAADPALAPGADRPGGWHGLNYYRLHGSPRTYFSSYDDDALVKLASELAARRAPTWCIFDNTAAYAAAANALDLKEMLT